MRRVVPVVVALVVGIAIGFALGRAFPPRGSAVEVELTIAAPGDETRQAVLLYQGADYSSALAAGNTSAQAGQLDRVVAVDKADPQSGAAVLAGFGVRQDGGSVVFSGRRGIGPPTFELRLVRVKGIDGRTTWELSEDSARRVADELTRPK
jgi:hypothetical protein